MKIKRLLILAVLPMMRLAANVRNCSKNNIPKKGDLMVAATVGYNSYTNVTAPSGPLTDYEVRALSTNRADKELVVGFEGDWFFRDQWKLNLGGGVSFTNNPGYPVVPGAIDENMEIGDGNIPNYRAVADVQSFAYNASTGAGRYFNTKCVPDLMWYTGARVGLAYGGNEMKHDEKTSMGKSVTESWNFRGTLTIGVDYFVLPALYVGAQIDLFAHTYNKTVYNPQIGFGDLSADSHNYSVLTAPTLEIGFKF